jgi:hypothetical protein
MESLPHRHLTTLTLYVDFAAIAQIGATRAGHRGIAPLTGGQFEGERLSGRVLGGHDWVVTRTDGTMALDVRLTLETVDGARVYLAYTGSFLGSADSLKRFRSGELLSPGDYQLRTVAKFESGDDRYRWLEDMIVVGIGEHQRAGPVYTLFEIGA